ncbi:MAG: phosphatidate cytidylyltransferase, partial [Planctomycetota bacterium]
TDIGAFTFGKLFGKHKLIVWLSPGKTWEGLAGGLLTAACIGAAVAPMVKQIPWYHGAWIAAVLGLIGQGGDLLESMLKRDAWSKTAAAASPASAASST